MSFLKVCISIVIIYREYLKKYITQQSSRKLNLINMLLAEFVLSVLHLSIYRSSRPEVFCKKSVLRNITKFTGKHRFSDIFKGYRNAFNFIKKESLPQVFSCKFCEISKNAFFHRTHLVAASVFNSIHHGPKLSQQLLKIDS